MTPAWHTLSAPERMQMVEEAAPVRSEHPLVSAALVIGFAVTVIGLWVVLP